MIGTQTSLDHLVRVQFVNNHPENDIDRASKILVQQTCADIFSRN